MQKHCLAAAAFNSRFTAQSIAEWRDVYSRMCNAHTHKTCTHRQRMRGQGACRKTASHNCSAYGNRTRPQNRKINTSKAGAQITRVRAVAHTLAHTRSRKTIAPVPWTVRASVPNDSVRLVSCACTPEHAAGLWTDFDRLPCTGTAVLAGHRLTFRPLMSGGSIVCDQHNDQSAFAATKVLRARAFGRMLHACVHVRSQDHRNVRSVICVFFLCVRVCVVFWSACVRVRPPESAGSAA